MLNKIRLLALMVTAAMLAGLVYTSVLTRQKNYDNLLFAAPQNQNGGASSSLIEDLEELNLESFMLTYEILANKQTSSERANTSTVVKWTNFTYPYICNYNMISGGFFTQALQEQQIKSAVLNELAAFDLFGGTNIIGNELTIESVSYTVTGVINDQDTENANVYLPVTLQTQGPQAIISRINATAAPEFIESKLKNIGISSNSHTFYNLGLIGGVITGRTYIALEAIICAILIFIFKKSFFVFRSSISELGELYKYNTMVEAVRLSPGDAIKAALSGLFMVLGAGIFLWTVTDIANRILSWGVFATDIDSYITDFFSSKLDVIQKYSGLSNIFFILFIVFIILDVILFFDTSND